VEIWVAIDAEEEQFVKITQLKSWGKEQTL
jgi:hypothetical protein